MNKRPRIVIVLVSLALVAVAIWWWIPQEADTIYVNGRLLTMDNEQPDAEALAIVGGRIVGVGTTTEIRRRFTAPNEVDLQGKAVLPGLIDAHAHFISLGIARMTVDLVGAPSAEAAADRVAERVQRSSKGQWIRGRGWNQNLWTTKAFPHHRTLDKVAPDHPVILSRIDGHALWVNKKALQIAGITRATPDPDGGKIVRDAQGHPTGVLIDNAELLVARHVPPPTDNELEEAILTAQEECLTLGLTGVHDMGVDSADLAAYQRLIRSDRLHMRIYAAVGGPGPTWERFKKEGPLVGFGVGRLTVRAIKLYADGALGSRGAAMIEPYSDDPSNRGLTVTNEQELTLSVTEALQHGFQVCTHAIGDRANSIVLDVYERAITATGARDHRLRVEHAQVLHPDDIGRFSKLRVLPSMQPTHCTSDMYWAEARLGHERAKGAYAWRSLLSTGVIIPCGSDFPVEQPNPLLGIYAAITRRDADGKPRSAADLQSEQFDLSAAGIVDPSAFDGGWYAGERMTLAEVLKGYTTWAATAAFEESQKGSLTVGKLADFIVLSEPFDEKAPERILATSVEATYIGGRKVFARP
jgi:hypothetical protein